MTVTTARNDAPGGRIVPELLLIPGFFTARIALDIAVFTDLEERETSANRAGVPEIVGRIQLFLSRLINRFCCFSFFFGEFFGAFPVKNDDVVGQLAAREAP